MVRTWSFRVLLVAAAFEVAHLIASWPSLTAGSSTVVLVVGAAICLAALREPVLERELRVRPRQWLPWLGVGLAVALWELALLLLGNDASWPPLSRLADPVDRLGAGRFWLTLLWLATGAWLVRRNRR